jgi:type II secretion system (T2SS) protein G
MKRLALMVVLGLVIVGIVVGVLWFKSGAGEVFDYLDQAKIDRARSGCEQIEMAAKQYRFVHGDWPKSVDVLPETMGIDGKALIEKEELLDPWSRPYQFKVQGADGEQVKVVVWSQGSNPSDAKGFIYNSDGQH